MLPTASIVVAALLESAVMTAAPERPATVSPGSATSFPQIGERCPTFSWGFVEGVTVFDLVVYEIQDEQTEERAPVIHVSLPGSAHSWTPSLNQGLEPGTRYAWYIRARDEWENGSWSEGRFFQVEAVPSIEEVTAALRVLRSYLAQNSESEGLAREIEMPAGDLFSDEPSEERTMELSAKTDPKVAQSLALTAGTSAIHAEVPVTEGVTYGVVGVSNSAAGAGLAGDNTAGGPDLVLGGATTNLFMTESGLDVPSAAGQTFNIQNSGAGGMTLQVEGNTAFHTGNDGPGSGLDADLLDGSDSSTFAAASHSHSGVYAAASHGHGGGDITSGTVAQSFVDAAIARDTEIFPTVLANDGAGSILDADLLDGAHASSFASVNHSHNGPLAQIQRFHGDLGASIPGSEISYSFRGPTVNVTVSPGQQIIGVAEAPLATDSGTASGQAGLCYQLNGSGLILNFVDVYYSIVEIDATRTPIAVSAGSPTNLSGTYTVGFCFKNTGPVAITDTDYMNGWVAVVNP